MSLLLRGWGTVKPITLNRWCNCMNTFSWGHCWTVRCTPVFNGLWLKSICMWICWILKRCIIFSNLGYVITQLHITNNSHILVVIFWYLVILGWTLEILGVVTGNICMESTHVSIYPAISAFMITVENMELKYSFTKNYVTICPDLINRLEIVLSQRIPIKQSGSSFNKGIQWSQYDRRFQIHFLYGSC